MVRPSKRKLLGRKHGFQKKINIELNNDDIIEFVEFADTKDVDVIDVVVDSSDDDIAELVGFEGDDPEEDVIDLEMFLHWNAPLITYATLETRSTMVVFIACNEKMVFRKGFAQS